MERVKSPRPQLCPGTAHHIFHGDTALSGSGCSRLPPAPVLGHSSVVRRRSAHNMGDLPAPCSPPRSSLSALCCDPNLPGDPLAPCVPCCPLRPCSHHGRGKPNARAAASVGCPGSQAHQGATALHGLQPSIATIP